MPNMFLYGPDLARSRIFDRLGACDVLGAATLEGYRVAFNKPNLKNKAEGLANLEEAEGETVYGVIYDISRKQKELLGGYYGGYSAREVRPTLKKTDKKVECDTFVAHRTGKNLAPTKANLALMIKGAEENGMPREFIEELRTLEGIDG